ncbi:MAG: pyruvate kinase [Planctomycetota bacterium]
MTTLDPAPTAPPMHAAEDIPRWMAGCEQRPPHAKIVATIGPATSTEEALAHCIASGVSVFRLNFSHGSLDEHGERLAMIRKVAAASGRQVAVLGDLQGPKIRIGIVPDLYDGGGIMVEAGTDIIFRADATEAHLEDGLPVFPTGFDRIYHDVEPGQRVLINDGAIRTLATERIDGVSLRCRVTVGGRVTTKKGINLPDSDLKVPAITDQDWACAEWAAKHEVDYVALSFVRTADEIIALKARLDEWSTIKAEDGGSIPVVAKIEKPQALTNLASIVRATDAVMVARGDLGVEMDTAQVPAAQKVIIETCQSHGKPVIVATQMLESMIEAHAPTRAEASDVANAVFDGADAVMLSGETAVGKHPALVVETMRRIIRTAEAWYDTQPHEPNPPSDLPELPHRSAALAHGCWHIAKEAKARLVVVWSQRGGMAGYLSQNDFRVPILACTTSERSARRMTLFGGVTPWRLDPPGEGTLADWTDEVEAYVQAQGLAEEGDAVLLVAGKPLGQVDAQDTVAILRVGDPNSGFRPR